jgi:plastocyanin
MTIVLVAAALGALALAVPASGGVHAAGAHTVVLEHDRFLPGRVSIHRGESVTWLWRDGATQHNVIAHDFGSRVLRHGSFTVRFTRAGTYDYTCTLHPHMDGRIVVH